MQDHYINIGNMRTRFWQAGDSGTPVVLIHGIGCSVLEWRHNIDELATQHRVFALDLLGFGLSSKPVDGDYSIRALAQFVLDFMTALHLPQAHLVGNSLGGRLAMECAIIAKERVLSMMLLAPAGVARQGALFEFRLSTLPLLGEVFSHPSSVGLNMLYRKAFYAPEGIVTKEFVAEKLALAQLPGVRPAFLACLRGFLEFGGFNALQVSQLQNAMPNIETPTLVVWGAEDRFLAVAQADVFRTHMPKARVEIWAQCGHVPQIEQAARFNALALSSMQN